MTQKWAIQDEATGEYFKDNTLTTHSFGTKTWTTYPTYAAACKIVYNLRAHNEDNATRECRIVPAPPREMTDAECWEWWHPLALERMYIGASFSETSPEKRYHVSTYDKRPEMNGYGQFAGWCVYGATPYDAIRAARRRLESGK